MVVCFHKPDEENGYLSNWYLSDFSLGDIVFSSMEQYMMYSKAILFKDYKIAKAILNTNNVAKIKALGRKVKDFDEDIWFANREQIVEDGLFAKFSQNDDLKTKLLNTGSNILAECAVKDTIWGIGLSMYDSNRFNESRWRGKNLLGKCLMNVRGRL